MIYQDSGGLGAVSFGISEALAEFLLFAILIGLNVLFRRVAQRQGRLAVRLHRLHLVATVSYALIAFLPGIILEPWMRGGGEKAVLTVLGVVQGAFVLAQLIFALWLISLPIRAIRRRLTPGHR